MNPVSIHEHILSFLSSFLQAGDKAFYFFSALSQVEAALFGIIFTITLFMVQIINDKYGINATKIIVEHKTVKSFISIFLAAIFSSLGALALTSSPFFAIIWPVGVIMGIIFIARIPKFLSDISNLVNIYSIVDEIIKKMPRQMTHKELKLEQANDSGWFRTLLDLLTLTIEKQPVSILYKILQGKIKPLFPTIVNNFPLGYYLELFYLPLLEKSIEAYNREAFIAIVSHHLKDLVKEIRYDKEKGKEFGDFLSYLRTALIPRMSDNFFIDTFIHDFLGQLPFAPISSDNNQVSDNKENPKYNETITQRGLDILVSITKDPQLSDYIREQALNELKQILKSYEELRFPISNNLERAFKDIKIILGTIT